VALTLTALSEAMNGILHRQIDALQKIGPDFGSSLAVVTDDGTSPRSSPSSSGSVRGSRFESKHQMIE
jgi:hypothetical protein